MCAQFIIRANAKKLAMKYGIRTAGLREYRGEGGRVMPHQLSPVVVKREQQLELELMQFSLLPKWSKEKKVKFATHNARLESFDEKAKKKILIFEKPTWRDPFLKRHCLVPISEFIEPIYTGKLAGNMVKFSDSSSDVMTAAGLWEEWIGKDGEVIHSFTIITDDPIPFVEKMGHDRTPLFLKESAFEEWLEADAMEPKQWVQFLRKNKDLPQLEVEKDRPLKAGWEKRI